jgi:hypothetical protein
MGTLPVLMQFQYQRSDAGIARVSRKIARPGQWQSLPSCRFFDGIDANSIRNLILGFGGKRKRGKGKKGLEFSYHFAIKRY